MSYNKNTELGRDVSMDLNLGFKKLISFETITVSSFYDVGQISRTGPFLTYTIE